MKKEYLKPQVWAVSIDAEAHLMAGSTSVSVSDESGKFEQDGDGDNVINARPHYGMWDQE